jgi:hypothetical protein
MPEDMNLQYKLYVSLERVARHKAMMAEAVSVHAMKADTGMEV